MGRPARSFDQKLAEQVSAYIQQNGSSIRQVAARIEMEPSSLARAMRQEAFSRQMKLRLSEMLGDQLDPVQIALRKALQILSQSDKLRARAEKVLERALASAGTNK